MLELADASLCAEVATVIRGGVAKLGVGKSVVVLGPRQGTTSGGFSLQFHTGRGKCSRNTPEIQETGNFRKRSARKLRRRKWSFYRRIWWITWFGSGSFSFRGLSFPENHLRISYKCS
jgi:hypothetical protein